MGDQKQDNTGAGKREPLLRARLGGEGLARSVPPSPSSWGCWGVPGGRGARSEVPTWPLPFFFAPPPLLPLFPAEGGGLGVGFSASEPPQFCSPPQGHCLPWRHALYRETPGRETKPSPGSGPGTWSPGFASHPQPQRTLTVLLALQLLVLGLPLWSPFRSRARLRLRVRW